MIALAAVLAVVCAATPAPPPAPDLAALWRDACLWEVGSNAEKVPAARKALIAEGDRVLDFLIPTKLDVKDTLVTRALQVVIGGIGRSAVPRLVPVLSSEIANVRRNAADLLGTLGAVEAAPAIAKLLGDPDARLGALAALAALKSRGTVSEVAEVMRGDAPERVRVTAAATLGAIGGDAAVAALAVALAARPAPLRFAAEQALVELKAVGVLRQRLGDADKRVRLHAIAALGRIADPVARLDLLGLLEDRDPVVRGFAAGALGTMLDEPSRRRLEARFAVETDPFARGKVSAALAAAAR